MEKKKDKVEIISKEDIEKVVEEVFSTKDLIELIETIKFQER